MPATTSNGNPYPLDADAPDGPAQIKALAEALNSIPAKLLASDSVEEAKIKDLAVTTKKIANAAIATAKLADGAVTEPKLGDGAGTSRKLKPTAGLIAASSNLVLTGVYADVPGGVLVITPAVPSVLVVIATFQFSNSSTIGSLSLDGETEDGRAAVGTGAGVASQTYFIGLSAAKHTIKMRAKRTAEVTREALAEGTGLVYMLFAS